MKIKNIAIPYFIKTRNKEKKIELYLRTQNATNTRIHLFKHKYLIDYSFSTYFK